MALYVPEKLPHGDESETFTSCKRVAGLASTLKRLSPGIPGKADCKAKLSCGAHQSLSYIIGHANLIENFIRSICLKV